MSMQPDEMEGWMEGRRRGSVMRRNEGGENVEDGLSRDDRLARIETKAETNEDKDSGKRSEVNHKEMKLWYLE